MAVGPWYLQISTANYQHVKIYVWPSLSITQERGCQVQNLDIFNPGKTCVEYLLHMLLGWLLVSLNQPDLPLRLVAGCTSLIFP